VETEVRETGRAKTERKGRRRKEIRGEGAKKRRNKK